MKPLHVVALAQDELRDARDWYERQGPGMGRRFVEAVGVVLEHIRENPRQFPVVHGELRRALVRRFPYGVFFLDQPAVIRVVAVVHLHRHPATWRRRR